MNLSHQQEQQEQEEFSRLVKCRRCFLYVHIQTFRGPMSPALTCPACGVGRVFEIVPSPRSARHRVYDAR